MKRWFLLVGLAGCSLTLSGPDANRPRTQVPQCDTGKGLVAMDGVLGAVAGVVALAVIGASGGAAAIVPGLLGAVFIGSAIHGNTVVDQCRAANADYVAANQREAPLPPLIADAPAHVQPQQPQPQMQQPQMPPQMQQPQMPPQSPPPPPPQQPQPWTEFWKEVR